MLGVVTVGIADNSIAPAAHESISPRLIELKTRAQNGDAEAYCLLGKAYHTGSGVLRDDGKAFENMMEAAKMGHGEAASLVGFFYARGLGVTKSETEAVEWFRKGADLGSGKSRVNYLLFLRSGKGVTKDYGSAMTELEALANSGSVDAQFALAQIYFLGDDLQLPDVAKAVPFLMNPAEKGYPGAQNMLGLAYRKGAGPLDESSEQAEKWFRLAAEDNDLKAQSNLASLLGVMDVKSPRFSEALMWLLISANQGEITAKKTLDAIRGEIPVDVMKKASVDARVFVSKFMEKKARSSEPPK